MLTNNSREMTTLICRLVLVLVATFASCAWADASFELERLSADQLVVAPGGSVTYAMRIRNYGDVAAVAGVQGYFHLLNRFLPAPYTLGPPADARCGSVHVDSNWQVWFVTESIAPGFSLDCEWPINRPLASKNDTWLAWQTSTEHPSSSGLTVIGTLTDTSIAARTLDFSIDDQGIGHASVELSIHNGGQLPIHEQSAGSCYAGGFDVIVLSGDGEGGCGEEYFSPACFTGGGYGFALPELQPGQTHRCTFEIRSFQPYTHPLAADFQISREQGTGDGIMLLDRNEDNNRAYAWLAPVGNQVPAQLISLRWPALALLILLCGFLGLRRQRSRTP